MVSHYNWGADRKTMLTLYRSLIRSKLDYGCFIYGSARKSYIELLDPIQNQALRLCLGAFRTSPAESLCAQAQEPPLAYRRDKLALQYAARIKSNANNPTYDTVFNPKFKDQYNLKPNSIPPLGIRLSYHIQQLDMDMENVSEITTTKHPPWEITPPNINFNLSQFPKETTPAYITPGAGSVFVYIALLEN